MSTTGRVRWERRLDDIERFGWLLACALLPYLTMLGVGWLAIRVVVDPSWLSDRIGPGLPGIVAATMICATVARMIRSSQRRQRSSNRSPSGTG